MKRSTLLAACLMIAGAALAWAASPKLTSARVGQMAAAHFSSLQGREAHDIVSKADVRPLVDALRTAGWKELKPDIVLERVLDDNDPLVAELRTSKGRELIRKGAKENLVYDRLDRVVHMQGGKQLLHDVAKLPDGSKLLAEKPTAGLKNLAQLLPKDRSGKSPEGVDFDKPTGRLYTAQNVTDFLTTHFESTQKSAAAPKGR